MCDIDYHSKRCDFNKDMVVQWRHYFNKDFDDMHIVYNIPEFKDKYGMDITVSCPNHQNVMAVIYQNKKEEWFFLGYVTSETPISHAKHLKPYAKVIWQPFCYNVEKSISLQKMLNYINVRMQKYKGILDKKQVIPSKYEDFELERYILFYICKHFQEAIDEFIFLEKKLFQYIRTAALKFKMEKLCDIKKGVSIESYIESIYKKDVPNYTFTFDEVALKYMDSYLQCVPYQIVNIARALGYI